MRPDDLVPVHRRARQATYDLRPAVAAGEAAEVTVGWEQIAAALGRTGARVIAVDAYPGVLPDDLDALAGALAGALPAAVRIRAEDALLTPAEVEHLVAPDLGDDPVFGRLTALTLADLLDDQALARLRRQVHASTGPVLVTGLGAGLVAPDADLLVLADLPRWEIQKRQRAGLVGSIGSDDEGAPPAALYKRGYFVDWRVADRHKRGLLDRMDLLLDTTERDAPKLVAGSAVRGALTRAVTRPLRVVPFFDPGPWGGQWMRQVCALPDGPPNYAWCFDCVPEENSLLLRFGAGADHVDVEIPALDLVLTHPAELLGEQVRARFGDEFPIRFDFLDTMGGGNLSLQVHPLTRYIREHFGIGYTQDESYYLLDVEPGASVYLGVRTDVDRDEMARALCAAQEGGPPFPAEQFVNRWPARRHDHVLIPAGTVHCSGAGAMVLEISATPYIFTFKLWDWDRLGLDGRPRPIHLEHGLSNIQWQRDTAYARDRLINAVTPLASGPGWRSERTGLHEAEFIDTVRHWFSGTAPHDTRGGVHVLNLVHGEQATVTSPTAAFAPFEVHYAETFIVPAAVGRYDITPTGPSAGQECATIEASVRER